MLKFSAKQYSLSTLQYHFLAIDTHPDPERHALDADPDSGKMMRIRSDSDPKYWVGNLSELP
jgi:hypothetical protein